MKIQNRKTYKLLIILIFLSGILFRLIPVFKQPIWLDEQFSIFFATQYSFKSMLFFFSDDVHPGLYYSLLKFFIFFTKDLSLLRILTSTIWQIIAIWLFIISRQQMKLSRLNTVIAVTFLSINPFFVLLSWQLRMYGLVFFLVVAGYINFKIWQKKKSSKHLFLLVLTLIIGNMTSYSMFFLSFFFGLYFIFTKIGKNWKKRIVYFFSLIFFLIVNFILLSGFNHQTQFEQANWINSPLKGVSSLYLTTIGLNNDINNQETSNVLQECLFLLILISSYFLYRKKIKNKKLQSELNFLVIFPTVFIIVLSIILPFLSHRLFFHNFVPNLSLFLPRTHLPIIIIFFIISAKSLNLYLRRDNNKYFYFIGIPLFILWIIFNFSINYKNTYSIYSPKELSKEVILENYASILWPAWTWFEIIDLKNIDRIPTLKSNFRKSNDIETIFWDNQLNIEQKKDSVCKLSKTNLFFTKEIVVSTLKEQKYLVEEILSSCCKLTKTDLDNIKKWECY